MRLQDFLITYKEKFADLLPYVTKARRSKPYFMQFIDILKHKVLINTSPVDYYRFQFYKSDKSLTEKSYYVGKRGGKYYPWENNQIKFVPILDNKYLFKVFLTGLGLPQPRLLATIGSDYEVHTLEQFIAKLKTIQGDCIIKPVCGSGGRGIFFLENKGNTFFMDDKPLTYEFLWEKLNGGQYIIEEKILQKDYLANLYPHSLNTFRLITIKTDDGKWHVAKFSLRLGRGGSRIDNSGAGGIQVYVNDAGKTYYPYDWLLKKKINKHPDTGAKLEGVEIENFQDILEVVLHASEKFNFMGTIGWDIAQTSKGLMIIEANAFYDCWYKQIGPHAALINKQIAQGLRPRAFYSRWDKTRIHPHFNRDKIVA